MKYIKIISFVFTMSLFFILVSCTNANSSNDLLKNLDVNNTTNELDDKLNESNIEINNKTNNETNNETNNDISNDTIMDTNDQNDESIKDDNKELNNEGLTNPLNYQVKKVNAFYYSGILRIDTYNDYLNFLKEENQFNSYNEEFFKNSSLILYGIIHGSGSIGVEITSVILEQNFDITINITTDYPSIGTCNIGSHQFIIEYIKPEKEVLNIKIKDKVIFDEAKSFIINDESVKEIKEFIDSKRESILGVQIGIVFIDDFKLNGLGKDEIKAHFEQFNNQNVIKYGLDRIKGLTYVSVYMPYVNVSPGEIDNLDLELLLEIANIDDLIRISITFGYKVLIYR